MSTDPFNIVKEELRKSINKTKSLIERYNKIFNSNGDKDELKKLSTEIKTSLRSISWDIQDLEETINIASKNPAKYNLTTIEIDNRRTFLDQTREFVTKTKQTLNFDLDDSSTSALDDSSKSKSSSINIRIPDIISNATSITKKGAKYSRLNDNDDSDAEVDTRRHLGLDTQRDMRPTRSFQNDHEEQLRAQDTHLNLISGRVSSLKNISQAMQNELEDQDVLLNDLGREVDTADSRMQNVTKKLTKILHLNDDKRQWTVIMILGVGIFILLILLFIL